MEVEVAQYHTDATPLRHAFVTRLDDPVFQHPGFPPTSQQSEDARVSDAVLHTAKSPCMVYTSEEIPQVRLIDPAHRLARDHFMQGGQGRMRPDARSAPKRAGQKVLLLEG